MYASVAHECLVPTEKPEGGIRSSVVSLHVNVGNQMR